MEALVYIDNEDSTDPADNLATEEYVLRKMDPARDYLLIYRNQPSVIVGRNQNILEEVNDLYVRDKGIRVLRRLSGGGTVYHDPGNLNFSFITRYEQSRLHNFRFFNEPVVRVLQKMGVPAEMNDRNDILADGRKISGNAQFSSRGRMFSHGTLLFNSDLDEVNRVLSVRMNRITSKSHKSVRSVVANISEFLKAPMDIHHFRELLLEHLLDGDVSGRTYRLTEEDRDEINKIRKERYETWDWNIGRSPRFNITRSRKFTHLHITVRLEVEKGVIRDAVISTDPAPAGDLLEIGQMLTGLRYEPVSIRQALETLDSSMLPESISPHDLEPLIYGEDEE